VQAAYWQKHHGTSTGTNADPAGQQIFAEPLRVRSIRAHHNWIAVAYEHFVVCHRWEEVRINLTTLCQNLKNINFN